MKAQFDKLSGMMGQGDGDGRKALDLFLSEYKDHPLGNPWADEAQRVFEAGQESRRKAYKTEVSNLSQKVSFSPFSFLKTVNQPKVIAILSITNKAKRKVTQNEIEYLTHLMRNYLSLLPKKNFLVMTQENIETMIPEGQSIEDCVGSCEVEIGRLLNAHWIITGEMIKFGKSLRVSIKIHNSISGTFIGSSSVKGKSIEELEIPIQNLSLEMMYKILPQLKAHLDQYLSQDPKVRMSCLQNKVCTSEM